MELTFIESAFKKEKKLKPGRFLYSGINSSHENIGFLHDLNGDI